MTPHRLRLLLACLMAIACCKADTITVAPGGSLHQALRQAREWRRTGSPHTKGGITILLRKGVYRMVEPLFLRPEDSGTPDSPTIIRGEDGATLAGDMPRRHTQLWPREGMERMLGFHPQTRTITIPTPPDSILAKKGLEMVVHQRWAIAILRVKDMVSMGDSTAVSFMEPESRLEFEHPWPQPVIGGERGSSSFLLRQTEQRDGIEQLVVVCGTEQMPVRNVTFENLTFRDACWNRPLHRGHVTLQGGFPIVDAYKLQQEGLPWAPTLENQAWIERPVAAVSISWAEQVNMVGCRFERLASTALDYVVGARHCTVSRNRFSDIGGTALLIGSFAEGATEVHRPLQQSEAAFCHHIDVSHNSIIGAACEDWGCVGIGAGVVHDVSIHHNEVSHVNYSGICIGWGWTPIDQGMHHNQIYNNKVSDYARQLYDAGGIYTLSNQPHSTIRDNDITLPADAPYATNYRAFCIYLDAETDGFTVEGNSMPAPTREDRPLIGYNHPGKSLIVRQ